MTTTTTKHGKAVTKSTKKKVRKVKLAEIVSKALFPIAVAVAGFILWFVLFTTGAASGVMGSYTFPTTMTVIVVIYNLAIMAWPTIKAFTRRRLKQLMGIRLTIISASILLTFLFPFGLRLIGSLGAAEALWGLRILGVVAIVLHGFAAVLLARYNDEDVTQSVDENIVTVSAENIREARKQLMAATADFNSAQDVTDDREHESKEATQRATTAREAATAVEKQFNQQSTVIDSGIEATLTKVTDERTTAVEAEATALMALKIAKIALSESANTKAIKEGALAKLINNQREATTRLEEAHKATKSEWRDLVFGPVACLVLAFVLYASWYGWVIAEFN